MKRVPFKFWVVMRLSKSSDEVQQIDSLPHKKWAEFTDARLEAQRLTHEHPNARGFVILEAVELVKKTPATISIPLETRI